MFQQTYNNMQNTLNQQYGNYNNPNAMLQSNMQAANQQLMQSNQTAMFSNQQQGFCQPRGPQPDYRGMGQNSRPNYMQQAPNVTMSTNMNVIGGMAANQGASAPPYTRPGAQSMPAGVQQQQQSQFQQQQRFRQMMAIQNGSQGQQAMVAHHLQRMNSNSYPNQPPPYNMG